MKTFLLLAMVLTACDVEAPPPSPWLTATPQPATHDTCDDLGPCVDSFVCEGSRLEDEPACETAAVGECVHLMVRDGLDCFPTPDVKTGKCQGGVCVR